MQKRKAVTVLLTGCILILGSCSSLTKESDRTRPNVVFVLSDDQGYGDIACNGNPWIKTPHMDKLASEGVRFRDYHVETTCAPTRAGLMTGMYCNKVGVWHTVKGRSILDGRFETVARMFQSAGYTTGIFGKWHLGDNYPYRPQDRGFDEVLIHRGGGVGQAPDYWNNDYFDDTYFHNGKPEKYQGFCTEVWFDHAIKFIEKAQSEQQPFFCYIPVNVPHRPWHVSQKYIDMYKDNPAVPHPAFYGTITNLDENIGRLRNKLEEMGLSDNTIFIFSTDNGTSGGIKGTREGLIGYNAGMRGVKGSPYEGGHRVPLFIYWKNGNITGGKEITKLTAYIDIAPTLLDLCNIPVPENIHFDGTSLKPLIYGDQQGWPDRILFTDTQRKEFLQKWKDACVMTGRWRLIARGGEIELYDIRQDPGEKQAVALDHPDVVKKLSAAYERWWGKVAVDSAHYVRIVIGSKEHPGEAKLSSMDCHTVKGLPAWDQSMVRKGTGEPGFWALDIARAGDYTFQLCRYPKESGLSINASAPEGEPVQGGNPSPVGNVLHIQKATIEVEGQKKEKEIAPNALSINFTLHLQKGRAQLKARFIDNKGKQTGVYYVYVKKTG